MSRSIIPVPKYKVGSYFRHIDTEQVYKLIQVSYDTYVLVNKSGEQSGESEYTLEYDYELLPEGEVLFHK